MAHIGCHERGRDIAKDEGLRMIQYGVVNREVVYVSDPEHIVEKVAIADSARVTEPVGERIGLQGWMKTWRKKAPKLRRRRESGKRETSGAPV